MDGVPAHHSQLVKEYLRNEAEGRVWLELLPGYAPDLVPEEGMRRHLILVELASVCCGAVQGLQVEFRRTVERLRHKRVCHPG